MMKKLFFLLVFLVLSSVAVASVKTPTVIGGTGLIRMPSGDILGAKEYNIGVDYSFANASASATAQQKGIWSYKINLGSMLGHTNGLELGIVGRTDPLTDRFKEGVFINIKYSLSSGDEPDALHLAIGLENLASYNDSDAYMVATKYFNNGLGLHFGAMFDSPNSKFRPLGMLGLELPLGSNDLTVMGEVFAGESAFQADAGARLLVNRQFAVLFRALNITNDTTAKDSQSYSVGISFKNPI